MGTNSKETPRHSLFDLWPWFFVLLVLLLVGFVRYRLLDMPLERDEGEYAYTGQLMLQGIPPYQLAFNMKLPGTYFAYALGMAGFGQTTAGIHATLMVANSLTIIFLFMLARKLYGSVAGIAACATFGILSVSPAVMGMAAHANHFVILFAVLGTLMLAKGEDFYRWYVIFFSGMCYGLAFLMKQQGICFFLFAMTFVIWSAIYNRAVFSGVFFSKICFLVLGMILPLALTYQYLQQVGVLSQFQFWTYTYASAYATELSPREGISRFLDYADKKWPIFFAFFGFVIVALPFMLRDRAYRNQIIFAFSFLFFSFLATAVGYYFREHYFILMLPALALFVGLAIISLQSATANDFFKIVPPLVCLLILSFSVYQQRGYFFKLPGKAISMVVYNGDAPFADMPAVGDYLRTNSPPNATVAVVGSEPEIYFYAQRHSATGYMYMYPLMEPQPYALRMQHEFISEITTNKPAFMVFVHNPNSWNLRPSSDQTLLKWFNQYSKTQYDLVAGDNSGVLKRTPAATNEVEIFKRKI